MIKKIIIWCLVLSAAFSFAQLVSYCERRERMISRQAFLMGTTVEIKVPLRRGDDPIKVESAIRKAFIEEGRVENVFSTFKEDSDVSTINSLRAGQPLKLTREVFDLIEKSINYSKKTSGAFDITVKPLVDLWDTAKKEGRPPRPDDVRAALAHVGYEYIILDKPNQTIEFKKEGMALDLGGVAKGYATDRAIAVLEACGIENAIVNSGGDMYCLGRKSGKELWKVGIQHPRDRKRLLLDLYLRDMAVDTSGDYERYFIAGGKRYSHIIDPRSGYPVGDRGVSATVIANSSVTADILATALCVLGEEGLDIAHAIKGVDAMVVVKAGKKLRIKMTKDFRKNYVVVGK